MHSSSASTPVRPISAPRPTARPLLRCPSHDPAKGVVPTIQANDPTHLIFDEPDNYASRGLPTYILADESFQPRLHVHIYCGARSPVTGNPTNPAACAAQDEHSLGVRASDRPEMASAAQQKGPALFVSEFGASSDPALLASITAVMDAQQVGWVYWAWKYLRRSDGQRGRVSRHGQWTPALDRPRLEPRLSAGGGRHSAVLLLLAVDRSVRHGGTRPTTGSTLRHSSMCRPSCITRTAIAHGRLVHG